jgi:indolepyruvate ferredoxin oxidoreductase alpha subunit
MKVLLSGNEAVARGAYEGGVKVATAYPGTPSTEILEQIAKYKEIYCEWSTNEKVALEVALGASYGGARALTAMKHVGLNVAADPLFSASYIGATGGLVIVSCDDPGMHSSQNEQDNRHYARSAKIPLLEPSDSQEAKDFTKLAFEISEKFDTPVLLRLTTRISHSKSVVKLGERQNIPVKGYKKDFLKRVLLPAVARKRHVFVEERMLELKKYAEEFPFNKIEEGKSKIGVITSGVSYQYAKEVFPDGWFLKLSFSYPLPEKLIRKFASLVKEIYIVEENDPFLETEIKAMGIKVTGKDKVPIIGELNPTILRRSFGLEKEKKEYDLPRIPTRPPALCPGCPHTPVYYALSRLKVIITGDIGCYTLGALPPLNTTDSCAEMGASISNALGLEKALEGTEHPKIVAIIGDSTFLHSGITPLIDIVYNKGTSTVIILDNSTTAMTGHQDHPGTGRTLMGEETIKVSLEKICKAIGIKHTYLVDPYNVRQTKEIINREIHRTEPSVIITQRPCVLLFRGKKWTPAQINPELCTNCKVCLKLGCPAISLRDEKLSIDEFLCTGCEVCIEICPLKAIKLKDPIGDTIKNPKL